MTLESLPLPLQLVMFATHLFIIYRNTYLRETMRKTPRQVANQSWVDMQRRTFGGGVVGRRFCTALLNYSEQVVASYFISSPTITSSAPSLPGHFLAVCTLYILT